MRRRDYPGGAWSGPLATTETISYGVLNYSFAAFLLVLWPGRLLRPARARTLRVTLTDG